MDIRSKIASFEAHNQQVRATSAPASPVPASPPTTARTTTREASQNRRERLAREANESPARMMKTGAITPSSLAERRRARQLQKQKRLSRETNSSPMTDDNNMKAVSRSSSESLPAQRRRDHHCQKRVRSVM